jgi:hypothetical protein
LQLQFDAVLLKSTIKSIMKKLDVSGAVVRVELSSQFWTYIYYESTINAAQSITTSILSSLRSLRPFEQVGNFKTFSRFHSFTDRPSSVKTITGIAIYESVVASELLRSNSSGKRFAYSENTTAFQRSMSKATDYLEVGNFFCSKVSSLVNQVRGKESSTATATIPQREHEFWIKYSGDVGTRKLVVPKGTTYPEFLRLAIIKVEAQRTTAEYVLLSHMNRLLESMDDILELPSDATMIVMPMKEAFPRRI